MKEAINLDPSKAIPWTISRGVDNPFVLNFSEDVSAFTDWTFNVKDSASGQVRLSLTVGDGLTIDDNQTISGKFIAAQAAALKKDSYFYEFLYKDANGNILPLFRADRFIVQDQNGLCKPTTGDINVVVGGSVININVGMVGFDVNVLTPEEAQTIFQSILSNMTPEQKAALWAELAPYSLGLS